MTDLKRSLQQAEEGYILVAEDNMINQIVIEQTLGEGSRPFVIVENGQDAVDAWRTKAPGLILMDISMPVMNGAGRDGHHPARRKRYWVAYTDYRGFRPCHVRRSAGCAGCWCRQLCDQTNFARRIAFFH